MGYLRSPKALTHYKRNCKNADICHTHHNFYLQLQRFFQQFFYTSNKILSDRF